MNYQDFVRLIKRADDLMASNKYLEAEDALYPFLTSDISDIDKATICSKLAIIHDRTGNSQEVLEWFDKGITYEQLYFRYELAKEKARYLADLGHCMEAVPIYEDLLKQAYVTEAEKEELRKEIKNLLSRAIGQWK